MHLTQVSVIVLIHQLLVVLELLVVFELSLRKALVLAVSWVHIEETTPI